ncbi:MAG: gliding motility-associated ABC transporter substrate-binding protein GldG [Saprospiraceae bacterium]
MKKGNTNILIQSALTIILIILVNLIAHRFYTYVDLTEDKRFTLEDATKKLVSDVDQTIFVEVLLEGQLNSGFIRLQNRCREVLDQLNNLNPNIEYSFTNTSEGTVEEINQRREKLRQEGIFPTTVFIFEDDQRVEKLIYPYAIINYGDRRIAVNLLEPLARGENEEEAVNRSAMLLEYKLASTISKLIAKKAPIIAFTEGHGELEANQTAMLETILGRTMNTLRIQLDSVYIINDEVDILIIAGPEEQLNERSQFIIDQYIMNGGNVIWLIEQFYINLDSINNNKVYVPRPVDHGLDDMFFKYGIRINRDVVLDLENTKIPQVYGMSGDRAQQQLFPWVFHPLLQGNQESSLVRNIDRVASYFPSTIEVLDSPESRNSTVLLTSSQYSRYQVYPSINISFETLRLPQKPEAYNKSYLPVAVMIEGTFNSYFKNRVSQVMMDGLRQINMDFKESSTSSKQAFIGDADIIKNLYDPATNRISPIGFNKWEGYTYEGNEDFIINTIDYMLDDYGLIEARSKSFKLRLLDQVRLKKEKLKWQAFNIALPVALVIILGLLFTYWRRRKYTD